MCFFERLDEFMKEKNLNDNKISVEADISNGLIGKGRKRGAISLDNVIKILRTYPELSPEWLLLGIGTMLKNSNNTPKIKTKDNNGNIVAGVNGNVNIDTPSQEKSLKENEITHLREENKTLKDLINSLKKNIEFLEKELEALKK